DGTHTAQLSEPVTGGVQYRIMVAANDGYDPTLNIATQGDFFLQWSLNPPDNDNVVKAIALSGASPSAVGTNVEATAAPADDPIAGFMAINTVWYQWTVPAALGGSQITAKT